MKVRNKPLIYIFLIFIILGFSYYNSMNSVEKFTPYLRRMYRPHIRNLRRYAGDKYDKMYKETHNYLKRKGLY